MKSQIFPFQSSNPKDEDPDNPFSNPKYKDVKFLFLPNIFPDAFLESFPWIFSFKGMTPHVRACIAPQQALRSEIFNTLVTSLGSLFVPVEII